MFLTHHPKGGVETVRMGRIQHDRATGGLRTIHNQITGKRQFAGWGGWDRSPALAPILAQVDCTLDAVRQAVGVEWIDAERRIQNAGAGLDPSRRGARPLCP
jgi:hypothetical protein